ncbi:MAG: SMC-Scp complex subunit ScpB [Euryarchaeota archaeon]|nr:SMC-Scp complex subunit ScpB [Euryarchaeota archaeon]
MSEQGVVEAALFSAGKPLAVEEIAQATGLHVEVVRASLEALAKAYDERGSAIEIARIGGKWTMQIRADYGEKAQAFAPPELAKDLLKTSALIAYYQPIKQSDLVRMVGSKAYEHVKALEQLSLITTKPVGQTLELRTGSTFLEFFGLPADDRDELKGILAERAGIASPPAGTEPTPPSAATSVPNAKPEKHV